MTKFIDRMRTGRIFLAIAILAFGPAFADNFAGVRYDPKTDELVVRMRYRGTNPDHNFTVQWGQCRQTDQGSTIDGDVLDDQARDGAHQSFTKTVRFDVSGIACRPARVTLHTAPRFYYQILLPVRGQ
ncbi:MAG TPA: hypothetical protein VGI93_01875 [Steroidobacteraceae bacterium]|jgi:hypothetical protein